METTTLIPHTRKPLPSIRDRLQISEDTPQTAPVSVHSVLKLINLSHKMSLTIMMVAHEDNNHYYFLFTYFYLKLSYDMEAKLHI